MLNQTQSFFVENDEDKLVLPQDYLTAIYRPGSAQANLFLVHPSHRYSGSFSAFAIGMKYQVCEGPSCMKPFFTAKSGDISHLLVI